MTISKFQFHRGLYPYAGKTHVYTNFETSITNVSMWRTVYKSKLV